MADVLDRIYDTLERGAAVVGTALGVDMRDAILPPDASHAPDRPPFEIREAIDAETGKVTFVVTDGHGASCDCPTRAIAEEVLAQVGALEGRALAPRRRAR